MAITKNYLDQAGLNSYDGLLKTYIDSPNTKAIKKVIWDDTAEKIKFYVNKDAVVGNDADFEVEVSSADVQDLKTRVGMSATLNAYQSKTNLTEILNVLTAGDATVGSVAKLIADAVDALDVNEIALTAEDAADEISIYGIAEVNGKIQKGASKVTLAKVAKTGAAADVSYTPANGSDITATNVQDAITEVETDYKAAIAALNTAADVGVASKNGKIVTITGSVKEENGIIAKGTATDIALAAVASTGKAEDISIDDIAEKITATTVEGALGELADAIATATNASKVTCETSDGGSGSDVLRTYSFYQGVLQSDDAAAKANKKIIDVNIPKDYLVKSAEIKTVTVADEPYTGAKVGDKYIDFTINTKDGDGSGTAQHIYIAINDLVAVIQGSVGAEITVTVGVNNTISATINAIDSDKIIYKAETSAGADDEVTVKDQLDILTGGDTVAGSVAKAQKDAIDTVVGTNRDAASASTVYGAKAYADSAVTTAVNALDGTATIATVSGDTITIKAGVSEADGVVSNATGDDIAISPIPAATIQSLFA